MVTGATLLHHKNVTVMEWFVGSIRKDVGISVIILQHIDAIVEE